MGKRSRRSHPSTTDGRCPTPFVLPCLVDKATSYNTRLYDTFIYYMNQSDCHRLSLCLSPWDPSSIDSSTAIPSSHNLSSKVRYLLFSCLFTRMFSKRKHICISLLIVTTLEQKQGEWYLERCEVWRMLIKLLYHTAARKHQTGKIVSWP
eukprot:scaffold7184_cov183-Amphora_coffeaeformis.AAC.1